MNAPSQHLNLLRHPRRLWAPWLPLAPWLALGCLCGGLCAAWLQSLHEYGLRERQRLASEQARLAAQTERQQAARAQAHLLAQQQARWRELQVQQQRIVALQDALQSEAEQGLRVSRWQADGQRLLLQGQGPQAQDWPALQARLGQVLGQGWHLQSLGSDLSAASVLWTLETAWPGARTTEAKP